MILEIWEIVLLTLGKGGEMRFRVEVKLITKNPKQKHEFSILSVVFYLEERKNKRSEWLSQNIKNAKHLQRARSGTVENKYKKINKGKWKEPFRYCKSSHFYILVSSPYTFNTFWRETIELFFSSFWKKFRKWRWKESFLIHDHAFFSATFLQTISV